MTERDHREDQDRAIGAIHTTATILSAALVVFLTAGLGGAISAGYKVGPYAAFGSGLTCISIAASMGVGVGALILHRIGLKVAQQTQRLIREVLDGQRALGQRLGGIEDFEGSFMKQTLDELGAKRANGHHN
jgi:hypothetical protein